MVTIALTEKQANFLDDYVFKRACRLKDVGLEDSVCYPMLMVIHQILKDAIRGDLK